jgi:integrase
MFRDRDGWRVQWREPTGARRSKKFPSKADARRFELELELGTADLRETGRVSPTFAAFAAEWLQTVCKTEKAKTQWAKDEEVIRLHLVPAFGEVRLSALRRAHLVRLKADLRQKRAKGKQSVLSPKTANLCLALAKRIMTTAVDLGHLTENPFKGVKLYRLPEADTPHWTTAERDLFLESARALDPAFTRLVAVACHTGLRLGELAALRREDLEFERRRIRVRGSYSVALQELGPTKGKEIAEASMNPVVTEALSPARFLRPGEWVFERSLFWSARKRLGRLAKRVGVPAIRFHDLRHTFASLLADEGVSLLQLQKLMRHKSPQMTLRYVKLEHERLAGLTDLLCQPARSLARNAGETEKVVGLEGLEPPTKRL